MVELVKTYKQQIPALRFIGKKYGDDDREGGGFGKQWDEWFQNGWFNVLEGLVGDTKSICEDGDAYIGLMRWKENESFEYWVGMFLPEGTPVPDGFGCVDYEPSTLGVGWLKGPESEVYGKEEMCWVPLEQDGCEMALNKDGMVTCMERYGCPRFTEPDENGNVILDICFFVK